MNYCFGVDIGGTTVKIGLFEETGTIVEKWEIRRIHWLMERQFCRILHFR